jgi:diaminopimelate decarboxylase
MIKFPKPLSGTEMKEKISAADASAVLAKAAAQGIINEHDSAAVFYDLTFLLDRFAEVRRNFPPGSLHAAAVKACPIINIIKLLNQNGYGLEAASLPEVYLGEKSGFPNNNIIFDSPAKTAEEIEYAINLGVHINADSLEELETINNLLTGKKTEATFGLRVNPQVGTGRIAITSVAGDYSKFGVPVKEFKEQIIDAYIKYEWLTGIHLHVGSQGCPLELLLKGVGVVYDLANEINSHLEGTGRQINIFDLGGGYPVSYYAIDSPQSLVEYTEAIKNRFPLLFTRKYKLITEFGRYYFANTAFAVSRADNIKHQKGITTLVSHLGGDFLIRKVYNPENWHHDMSVADKAGKLKTGAFEKYVIAGPLCFGGDVLEKEIELPKIEKEDYLIIHDVGAYTLSMWSRYNSRQVPKVIGYYNDGEDFVILKERETLDNVYNFWE